MSGLLDGKVAIVTGAAHGIGRGHAIDLARHGARVVVNDLGTSVTGVGADQGGGDVQPGAETARLLLFGAPSTLPSFAPRPQTARSSSSASMTSIRNSE